MTWGCPLLLELGALGFVRFVHKRRLHTVASMAARRPPGPGSEDGWDLGGEGSGPFLAVSEPGCAQHSPSGGGSAGRATGRYTVARGWHSALVRLRVYSATSQVQGVLRIQGRRAEERRGCEKSPKATSWGLVISQVALSCIWSRPQAPLGWTGLSFPSLPRLWGKRGALGGTLASKCSSRLPAARSTLFACGVGPER